LAGSGAPAAAGSAKAGAAGWTSSGAGADNTFSDFFAMEKRSRKKLQEYIQTGGARAIKKQTKTREKTRKIAQKAGLYSGCYFLTK